MKKSFMITSIISVLIAGFSLYDSSILADDPPIWEGCTNGTTSTGCVTKP